MGFFKTIVGLSIVAAALSAVWKCIELLLEGSFATDSVVLYVLTSLILVALYKSATEDDDGKDSTEESTLPKS